MSFHYTSKKRGFILFSVVIISFLLISIVLLIQIFVNSRLELYKTNFEKSKIISDKYFLEEILKRELELVEMEIKNKNIAYAYEFFSLNRDKKEIFKLDDYSERITLGGYRLCEDRVNFDYKKYLKDKLEKISKLELDISYQKSIKIQEKTIIIYATVSYESGFPKEINNLTKAKLKRIWIKEDD